MNTEQSVEQSTVTTTHSYVTKVGKIPKPKLNTEITEDSIIRTNDLLDMIVKRMRLKSDADFCRAFGFTPPQISKLRHGRVALGIATLATISEGSGVPLRDLKELMGYPVLKCLTRDKGLAELTDESMRKSIDNWCTSRMSGSADFIVIMDEQNLFECVREIVLLRNKIKGI